MMNEKNCTIEIKKLGINGEGIGYLNKKCYFVDKALPGEVVNAVIDKEEDKYAYAHIDSFVKESPFRVKPLCPIYEKCGACSLQHLDYQKSLEYKRELVIEALGKYSNVNPKSFEIKDTIGMENPNGYRNKASIPVFFDGKKLNAGLYEANSNKMVFFDDCLVHNGLINKTIKEVLKVLDKYRIKAYNPKYKNGFVRYIVCRMGVNTKEISLTIVLVKNTDLSVCIKDILAIPYVKSLYSSVNSDYKSHEIFGNNITHLGGEKTICEKLKDKTFHLLPNAFFQLNTTQTVKLYDEIKKAAKLSKKEIVLDAYCGVGTISKWVSDLAYQVIGIDNNKEAIMSANQNKEGNCKFLVGEVKNVYPKLIKDKVIPDVVLVDPPRVGLGEEFISLLLTNKPKRIVYTSCNPATLAKDLNLLKEKYTIKYIQPIDMFPYTAHVECVTLLELKK